jgi:magnesium transporter
MFFGFSVFIGEKYIITLHEGEVKPLSRLFQECKENENFLRENFANGSAYLFYRIIDSTIDAYFPILDKILRLLDDTEDRVFDENVEVAMEISTLRRDVITQRRIAFPMRSVISEMDSKLKRFSKIDMSIYFDDLLDHANKICETLDECKEVIEVFKDADYILSNERLNRIMRTLTIISTIMLPLIVLSGLWSMNIPLPFGADPGGHHYFFYIMVAILLIVVCGMLYLFRRKRWI